MSFKEEKETQPNITLEQCREDCFLLLHSSAVNWSAHSGHSLGGADTEGSDHAEKTVTWRSRPTACDSGFYVLSPGSGQAKVGEALSTKFKGTQNKTKKLICQQDKECFSAMFYKMKINAKRCPR